MEINKSEAVILGTVIYNNDMYMDVVDELEESDFYSTANQLLFRTISKVYKSNNKFDRFVIENILKNEIKEGIITRTYITELLTYSDPFTFKSHIKIVKEESNKREIANLLKKISTKKTSTEMLLEIENTISNIKSKDEKNGIITLSEAYEQNLNNWEENFKNGGKMNGISSGIEKLDLYIHGIQKKEFNVFAARPSCGKTTFSLKLINNMDAKILYVQLDMGIEAIINRITSSNLDIPVNSLSVTSKLKDNEWQRIATDGFEIANSKDITFFQSTIKCPATISNIKNVARRIKLKKGLDVIVIDHIGKIKPETKGTRYEQMTVISNELKRMAIELDVNVTALCQLSRGVEGRTDRHPRMSDLRDTGAIEEDADSIGLLYREGYYVAREEGININNDILEVEIVKARNGRLGKIEFEYNLETQKLTEILD